MRTAIFTVFFVFVLTIANVAQNRIAISFPDSSVLLKLSGQAVAPQFTPGNNRLDDFLSWQKVKGGYRAVLPIFQRGMSSGRLRSDLYRSAVYHISSGYVPARLSAPLLIKVTIPKGKALIWVGRVWKNKNQAVQRFSSYFVAREFPIILVDEGSYLVRTSRFNRIDSLTVVYVWHNNAGKAVLPEAFRAVDTSALRVGYFAPTYLDKNIKGYAKRKYLLTYFLTDRVVTGLEHYNTPYIMAVPRFIRIDGAFHTLFHSFVGKAIIPKSYMSATGQYSPSDLFGLYEGLTTYMSMKQLPLEGNSYASFLSSFLFRAKLKSNLNDIRLISSDLDFESCYAKGFLFWVWMEANGLDVNLFSQWLFSIYLIDKPFPFQADWSDVLKWISIFDKRLGRIAQESSPGDYLAGAFYVLQQKGWEPLPLKDMPDWYDLYIGPYSVRPGRPQLPTDNYPAISAYPVYLIDGDVKLKIEPDKTNAALRKIKDNPDTEFKIEFSDGQVRAVKDRLLFSDGSPYFMNGKIDLKKDPAFWARITKNIK